MLTIGDTQGFSGITPITPSKDFSIETLTGVTLLWKTKSNRSIVIAQGCGQTLGRVRVRTVVYY